MEGLQENLPDLEIPCPIFILTKADKIPRGPATDVSKFAPGFMLQMNFAFFDVESIRGFTLNQDKKVAFVQVDSDGALAIFY